MTRYGHTLKGQTAEAVKRLPNLCVPAREPKKATGTDGKPDDSADCLAQLGARPFTNIHQQTPATPAGAIKNRDSKANGGIRTHNPWFTKPELYR